MNYESKSCLRLSKVNLWALFVHHICVLGFMLLHHNWKFLSPAPTPIPSQSKAWETFTSFVLQRSLPFTFLKNDVIIILLLIVWLLTMLPNIIQLNVRYVKFNSNLSMLPKHSVPNSSNFSREFWFILIIVGILFDHHLLFFIFQSMIGNFVVHDRTLIAFYRNVNMKIQQVCFLSYKSIIFLICFTVYSLLGIPGATLWYYLLVIYLSNDISKNPGPNRRANSELSFFSFCNWNLNTLSKNEFERISLLRAHNSLHNYDIISLCETSLGADETVPENILPGYQYFGSNHPSGKKKGGVGIFYKDSLPIKIRTDLSFDECIVVELRFKRKKIFFSVLYRNPLYKVGSCDFLDFMGNFLELHTKIASEKPYTVIFTGDFNAHSIQWWPGGDSNNEGDQLNTLFSELGLSQMISEPTHFMDHCQPSCIDLVVCDQPNLVIDSGVRPSPDPACKHQIVFCKLSIKLPPIPSYQRLVWHYDKADGKLIEKAISDFEWEGHLNTMLNPNAQVKFLNQTILNTIANFVPSSNLSSKFSEPKWISRDIKNLMRKQKKLYRKYRLNGFKEEDKVLVDRMRDDCFHAIKLSKENYLKSLGERLVDKETGPKAYWSIINSLLNKCKIPRIPPLLISDKIVTDCMEKAKLFNDYFLEQCKPLNNDSTLPTFNLLTNSYIDTIEINQELILNIIKTLNVNKAHGPDDISGRMIILCGEGIALPLRIIFQNIIDTGVFPSLWKSANVTPVHKKESKQVVKNYRPISLLPLFAKIFERILFAKMYNHFINSNLITSNQSGFRPNDSVTNQLIFLVEKIHSSLDVNLDVRYVFLDMSKAFDKVWHEGLIFKLKQNGIRGHLLKLMENYLSNRSQRVVLNGFKSEWGGIKSGVPQGSVLGPLLFLVYINDLEKGIKSNVKFFADDTSLFSIVVDPTISAAELNHDLALISQWAYQWKMSFNPDPTKQAVQVLFSRKKNPIDHPKIYFNNIEVKSVTEHKHLGLILDSKLTFTSHINEKISKASKGLGILKALSRYLSVKTLDQIYKMYIRPHFDFCDVIYHIPSITNRFCSDISLNYLMNTLERIQYKAALAVTGAWKGTNLSKIYDELGWEPLSDRRWARRLTQFYKIYNDLTPAYLKILVSSSRNPRYATRSGAVLNEIRCKTNSYRNSFYPDSIRCWNKLFPQYRNSISLKAFKNHLLALYRFPPKSIFNIHDPLAVKWLFQLRVGLSPLLEHKMNHHFVDTLSNKCVVCNRTENPVHFFLECLRYTTPRDTLLNFVQTLKPGFNQLDFQEKVRILLYGDNSFNVVTNKLLLEATLKYLKETDRFVSTCN